MAEEVRLWAWPRSPPLADAARAEELRLVGVREALDREPVPWLEEARVVERAGVRPLLRLLERAVPEGAVVDRAAGRALGVDAAVGAGAAGAGGEAAEVTGPPVAIAALGAVGAEASWPVAGVDGVELVMEEAAGVTGAELAGATAVPAARAVRLVRVRREVGLAMAGGERENGAEGCLAVRLPEVDDSADR
jgi:hypothetical protein